MNILNVIDTLKIGGAEKMAVNIANLIQDKQHNSFLMATRKGGDLEKALDEKVNYVLINKESTMDIRAFYRMYRYIVKNEIEIIHAHSSSVYSMIIIKIFLPRLKLIWHNHSLMYRTQQKYLTYFYKYINAFVCVNEIQKQWAVKLFKKTDPANIKVLPNFIKIEKNYNKIPGNGYFTIINIANFRREKDHLNLLMAFKEVLKVKDQCRLILIGDTNCDTSCTSEISQYITDHALQGQVVLTGSITNINDYMEKADLGVVSSRSEALPVSLIELGLAEVPIVSTAVGGIPELMHYGEFGILVDKEDPGKLAKGILSYFDDPEGYKMKAGLFKEYLVHNYTQDAFWSGYYPVLKKLAGI